MNRVLMTLVAGMFAATAVAQTPAPAPATDAKAKQEMVKSATEGTEKGYGRAAAEGSAKAAEKKGTTKALPDKASKQQAVGSVTKQTAGTGYGQAAAARLGEGSSRHIPPQGKAEAAAPKPGDERGVEAVGHSPQARAAPRTTRRAETE